jgi:hypothetical protein
MALNYFVEKRKEDKQKLLNFIREHPDMTLKKILAIHSMNTGLSTSRLEVYLKELKEAELIAVNLDELL